MVPPVQEKERDMIIAKFLIGKETVEDGAGAICIALDPNGLYRVVAEGGELPEDAGCYQPNSRGEVRVGTAPEALEYALDVVRRLADESEEF
jgi:hypothetical protein